METNQILLTEINFSKLKEKIKKEKLEGKTILYSSEDDELNRKVMEKLPINIILINQKNRKDFQKQRNSGFNQVMAKVAKKQNITIGINFDEIGIGRDLTFLMPKIARKLVCGSYLDLGQGILECLANIHKELRA